MEPAKETHISENQSKTNCLSSEALQIRNLDVFVIRIAEKLITPTQGIIMVTFKCNLTNFYTNALQKPPIIVPWGLFVYNFKTIFFKFTFIQYQLNFANYILFSFIFFMLCFFLCFWRLFFHHMRVF